MPVDDFTVVDNNYYRYPDIHTGLRTYETWSWERRETEQASRVYININPLLLGDLKIFHAPKH